MIWSEIFRSDLEDLSSEDEAVATDLDMHALILSSSTDSHSPEEPLKTAEEVLREIDDIMQVNEPNISKWESLIFRVECLNE